jgi:hypothetical protein
MKNIVTIIIVTLMSINAYAQKNNYKVFPFKSAIVEYKVEGNSQGHKTKYIDQYGYKQADYSEIETKVFGFTNNEKKTTILVGQKSYTVDYKQGKVFINQNPVYETYANSKGDYENLGKEALKSLGFSNTGKSGNILGKKCQIWKGNLGEVWIWKSLALKSKTNILGITINEIATKIEIGQSIPSSKFEYPKGMEVENTALQQEETPQDMYMNTLKDQNEGLSKEEQQMMQDAMNGNMDGMMEAASNNMSKEEKDQVLKIAKMSYSDFKKMIKKEEPNISDAEIKQAHEMTKQMAKYIK